MPAEVNNYKRARHPREFFSSADGSKYLRAAPCRVAPLAELVSYQSRLNAMTAGQGRYTLLLSHYDAVPPNTQAALSAAYQGTDEPD